MSRNQRRLAFIEDQLAYVVFAREYTMPELRARLRTWTRCGKHYVSVSDIHDIGRIVHELDAALDAAWTVLGTERERDD